MQFAHISAEHHGYSGNALTAWRQQDHTYRWLLGFAFCNAVQCIVTVTNTGNIPLVNLSATGQDSTQLSCDSAITTLAVGNSTTCTVAHTLTAAEVAAGQVTYNVTATADPAAALSGALPTSLPTAMVVSTMDVTVDGALSMDITTAGQPAVPGGWHSWRAQQCWCASVTWRPVHVPVLLKHVVLQRHSCRGIAALRRHVLLAAVTVLLKLITSSATGSN